MFGIQFRIPATKANLPTPLVVQAIQRVVVWVKLNPQSPLQLPPPIIRHNYEDTTGFRCQPGCHKTADKRVIGLGPSISVHVKELVAVVSSTT